MVEKYVYEENTFKTTTQQLDPPGSVTIEQQAYILAKAGNAFELSDGVWTIKTDGTVEGAESGIFLLGDKASPAAKNSALTVGTEGILVGHAPNGFGVKAQHALDVTNAGLIEGGLTGIQIDPLTAATGKSFTITNKATGTITGGDNGIVELSSDMTMIVKNDGVIGGGIYAIRWTGALVLNNSGNITDDLVSFSPDKTFAATITNSGTIADEVLLSDGNDVVKNTGGMLDGISFHDGKNSLTNSGLIIGGLFFGSGDDTMSNTGSVTGVVEIGEGVNKVTNSGGISGHVVFGDLADTLTNSGTIGDTVLLKDGNNKLTNSGMIDGIVAADDGDDTVANTGHITGFINLGAGNNKFANGGTIGDDVIFSSGNDTVTNTKAILGSVFLGEGTNKLVNSGTIGNFAAGGNSGDTVTNSGTISGPVSLGGGDDVVKNTGHVLGSIDLGSGNDVFTGGNFADSISDASGNDVYKLGGGDDSVLYGGAGNDLYEGGAGFDSFDAGSLGVAYWVNLDTKATSFAGPTIAAGVLAPIFGVGGSAILKGFEQFTGGSTGDFIFGGAAAETLNGAGGSDLLLGGGGADVLIGGAGADTYAYASAKDSGATKAARDLIVDFEGAGGAGGDTIDLSAIDANTKMPDDQDFSWIGPNKAFTAAGQLRSVTENGDTVLQGDTNGDGKADFAIVVSGTQAFISTDFDL